MMMAGGAALSSRGFAGARRHLRVISWGPTTLGLGFCVNPAAIKHDFRSVWKWFSCYLGMKNVSFKHENRGFRA
jgi:hypothetical protein